MEEKTSWRREFESLAPGPVIGWAAHEPGYDASIPTTMGDALPNGQEWYERLFYQGYGGTEGWWFTIWTADRVYFPVCYDGLEWIDSVPRYPCAEATEHVGGD